MWMRFQVPILVATCGGELLWSSNCDTCVIFGLAKMVSVVAVTYAVVTTRSSDLNWKLRAYHSTYIALPALSVLVFLTSMNLTRLFDRKDQKRHWKTSCGKGRRLMSEKRTNYYMTQQLIQNDLDQLLSCCSNCFGIKARSRFCQPQSRPYETVNHPIQRATALDSEPIHRDHRHHPTELTDTIPTQTCRAFQGRTLKRRMAQNALYWPIKNKRMASNRLARRRTFLSLTSFTLRAPDSSWRSGAGIGFNSGKGHEAILLKLIFGNPSVSRTSSFEQVGFSLGLPEEVGETPELMSEENRTMGEGDRISLERRSGRELFCIACACLLSIGSCIKALFFLVLLEDLLSIDGKQDLGILLFDGLRICGSVFQSLFAFILAGDGTLDGSKIVDFLCSIGS
ncbi:hypothetical protein HPP92_002564 [Vanilla planifolia]|uniref:Uncharacterized protein n=1 Tax=Vanilla planifolia TaxID=51239 RepID=A0A835VI33_VANPL|nr:hypothetical protein HPP92_002564 [Vanilla planifolia]